jgi:hypothetical protein
MYGVAALSARSGMDVRSRPVLAKMLLRDRHARRASMWERNRDPATLGRPIYCRPILCSPANEEPYMAPPVSPGLKLPRCNPIRCGNHRAAPTWPISASTCGLSLR